MMTDTYWFDGGSRRVKLLTLSMDLFFEMLLGNVVCKAQPGPWEELRAVELEGLPPGTEVQAVVFDSLRREVVLRLANPAWELVDRGEPVPQLELIIRSRTFQVLDPSGAVLANPCLPIPAETFSNLLQLPQLKCSVGFMPVVRGDHPTAAPEWSVVASANTSGPTFATMNGFEQGCSCTPEQELEDFKQEYERNLAAAIQADPLLAGRTCSRCQLATPPDQLHAHNEALLCGPCLAEVLK